jgi:hypothetical protein
MIQNTPDDDANQYQSAILKLYLELPETPSRAGPHDRKTAAELHGRSITLVTVESAMLLASVRRLGRPPDRSPLPPIRSLAYFIPVIEELLDNPIPDDYREYLRKKVRLLSSRGLATKCG